MTSISKHVSLKAVASLVTHLDGIDLRTVNDHGIAPEALPKRYLTEGRWYYITGRLIKTDGSHLTLGACVKYVGKHGGLLTFHLTHDALEKLDMGNVAPAEAPLALDPAGGTPVHLFKFNQRRVDVGPPPVALNGLTKAVEIVERGPHTILDELIAARASESRAEAIFEDAANAMDAALGELNSRRIKTQRLSKELSESIQGK